MSRAVSRKSPHRPPAQMAGLQRHCAQRTRPGSGLRVGPAFHREGPDLLQPQVNKWGAGAQEGSFWTGPHTVPPPTSARTWFGNTPHLGPPKLGASQRNPYDVRGRQARAPWVFTGVRPVQGPHQILRSQLSRVPAMETSQGQAGPPPATRKGVPCRAVPPDGDGQTRLARGLVCLCGHLALAAVPTCFPLDNNSCPTGQVTGQRQL